VGRSYSIPCGGKRTTGKGRVRRPNRLGRSIHGIGHGPLQASTMKKHAIPCIIFPAPRARDGRRPRALAGHGAWRDRRRGPRGEDGPWPMGRGKGRGKGQGVPGAKGDRWRGHPQGIRPGPYMNEPARPRCNNHATQRNGHDTVPMPLQRRGISAGPP
jgi:hypothetical protein